MPETTSETPGRASSGTRPDPKTRIKGIDASRDASRRALHGISTERLEARRLEARDTRQERTRQEGTS